MKALKALNPLNFIRFSGAKDAQGTDIPLSDSSKERDGKATISIQGLTLQVEADFEYKEVQIYYGISPENMEIHAVLPFGHTEWKFDFIDEGTRDYNLTPYFKAVFIKHDLTYLETDAIQRTYFNTIVDKSETSIVTIDPAAINHEVVSFSANGRFAYYQASVNTFGMYVCKTPFDISDVITLTGTLDASSELSTVVGMAFSPDGTTLILLGVDGSSNQELHKYKLTEAWDIRTAEYASDVYDLTANESMDSAEDLDVSQDGLKVYVLDRNDEKITELTLTDYFDLSTATNANDLSVTSYDGTPAAFKMSQDGKKIFLLGRDGSDVTELSLSTAWDTSSTVTEVGTFDATDYVGGSLLDILNFSPDFRKMYIGNSAEFYQLDLS